MVEFFIALVISVALSTLGIWGILILFEKWDKRKERLKNTHPKD